MWHTLEISTEKFFQQLLQLDQLIAQQTCNRGCQCGGRLHRADYPRKPRGVPDNCEIYVNRRLSFCCAGAGCRRRTTPPSVRFMSRRVYVAAAMLMACAHWRDIVADQVPTRTKRRWRTYFTTKLVASARWQEIRARLHRPVEQSALPGTLLERIEDTERSRSEVLTTVLRLLLYGPNCMVL